MSEVVFGSKGAVMSGAASEMRRNWRQECGNSSKAIEDLMARIRVAVRKDKTLPPSPVLTSDQAAVLLRLSVADVERLVGRWELLTVEIGSERLIPRSEVERISRERSSKRSPKTLYAA
ncbi:MAG: helix-turn-helix domain-containing protein [Myxococcaceae bacterium]